MRGARSPAAAAIGGTPDAGRAGPVRDAEASPETLEGRLPAGNVTVVSLFAGGRQEAWSADRALSRDTESWQSLMFMSLRPNVSALTQNIEKHRCQGKWELGGTFPLPWQRLGDWIDLYDSGLPCGLGNSSDSKLPSYITSPLQSASTAWIKAHRPQGIDELEDLDDGLNQITSLPRQLLSTSRFNAGEYKDGGCSPS